MASTGINLKNLTLPNGAVEDLNQLIWLKTLGVDNLGSMVTVVPRAKNGEKVGLVGQFGPLIHARVGCDPKYYNHIAAASEKVWELNPYEIAEQMCFEDVEETCAYNSLKTGTDIADFTGTDYLTKFVQPLLEQGLTADVFRLVWFGDKDAATAENGGVFANADDLPAFNIMDGLFKRIQEVVAADADRLISIDANDKDSWSEQYKAIREAGVAQGIFDELITKAKTVLRDQGDRVIYCTLALADALSYDIRNNNKGSELQWRSVFAGVNETTYNGTTIRSVPFWDDTIQTYEAKGDGGAYHKPFRAVFTTVGNLLVGTPGTGLEGMATLDITFNHETRLNKIYGTDKLGTLLLQDDLLQVAL